MTNNNFINHDGLETEVDQTAVLPDLESAEGAAPAAKPKFDLKTFWANKTARIAVCSVLGAAIIGGGAFAAYAALNNDPKDATAIAPAEVVYEEDDSIEHIDLNYSADGLKEDSTPVIVHIVGQAVADPTAAEESTDGEATSEEATPATIDIDFYHAFSAKDVLDHKAGVDVQKGTYQVAVLPSLNADGSMNSGTTEAIDATKTSTSEPAESSDEATSEEKSDESTGSEATEDKSSTPSESESSATEEKSDAAASDSSADTGKTDESTDASTDATEDTKSDESSDTADDKSSTIEVKGETTPAEDVSKEQIDKVLDDLQEAVTKGDDTLTGDKGATVTDDYKKAAEANPNTSSEEIEQKTEEVKDQATTEPSQAKTDSSNSSTSSAPAPSAGNNNSGSSSGNTSSSSNTGNSGNTGGNTSASETPKAETHTHTWATRWVQTKAAYDEKVQTKAAWDEQVTVSDGYYANVIVDTHYYFFADGSCYWDDAAAAAHGEELALSGKSGAYKTVADYEKQWVDTSYTTTKHHDAEYTTVHHDAEGYNQSYCTGCGATK